MTSQQLHAAMDSVGRYERVLCILGIIALFGIIWIPLACESFHLAWLDDRPWVVSLIVLASLIGVIFLLFGGMWLSIKWHGLLCPHCRKPLTTRYPRVLATGTCSHCGKSVIDQIA